MSVSQELKAIIAKMAIPERGKLNKEISELMLGSNIPEDLATDLVYRKYKGNTGQQLVAVDPAVIQKLDTILTKIEASETNIKSLIENKARFYVDKGYSETDAFSMAKAEIAFHVPSTSGFKSNLDAAKQESDADSSGIDAAVNFLKGVF